MKIYHTETQEDYDALMIELEEKGYKWFSGHKPTFFRYWESLKENTCIKISGKDITFWSIERHKKEYQDIPIIEYKAKGENMKEEMKHNLQEAKSSAKKLIEKIDEYLENLKPEFKVGDYVTVYVNGKRKIAKIDELTGYNSKAHGLWYDQTLVNVKQDYWFSSGLNKFRHAKPEEIAEYEVALTFHKHGRKPFEVKDGDLLENVFGKYIAHEHSFSKEDFTVGGNTFLKTAEEFIEWLGADDE